MQSEATSTSALLILLIISLLTNNDGHRGCVSSFSFVKNNAFFFTRRQIVSLQSITDSSFDVKNTITVRQGNNSNGTRSYGFSIPLINARPKPNNVFDTFVELWNDPRPVTSLIGDRATVGTVTTSATNNTRHTTNESEIPYCIISDEFEIEGQKFQILLYPRGRFVSSSNGPNGGRLTSDYIPGPASAYLRYLPQTYGDEIDIAWKLQLLNTLDEKALPVATSGGLPKSNTTWSAAMTFCTESEAIESIGRATDWGSSSWSANDLCSSLSNIMAKGEITIFGPSRKGESSFSWPLGSKGGIGALRRSIIDSSSQGSRDFRVGEVIVPIYNGEMNTVQTKLLSAFIYPGIDYRIMTMTDSNGDSIFSTSDLTCAEKNNAKLALRPCGWKLQQQLWQKDGMMEDWPVEVEAGLLARNSLTRFNPGSAIPRIVSAFRRDWLTYTLALLVAISPIPIALLTRNALSFYVIPSASMEPTLLKGDVLFVEKFPGVYDRTKKGDVILFKPPETLLNIIASNGGSPISGSSLFVKRIIGLPGDRNILMDETTKEISVDNQPSVGPDRNLCDDEPLRLIDRLLVDGLGKNMKKLEKDAVYVLGDCKAVSVDSRVFGALPKENIVGRPISRVWPPDRISTGPF